jgi:hypothetical protein
MNFRENTQNENVLGIGRNIFCAWAVWAGKFLCRFCPPVIVYHRVGQFLTFLHFE